MPDRISRPRSMCLKLSEDEMNTLAQIANQRGIPKVGVIRQWIREHSDAVPMSDSQAVRRALEAVFGNKFRKKG